MEGFRGCDAIALATHGRSGPARWVMGSVTERVLGTTTLPLLIVRPRLVESEKKATRQVAGSEQASWTDPL